MNYLGLMSTMQLPLDFAASRSIADLVARLPLSRMPRVLSLGGGLDSWAMLLDAELRGELPDVVAFVDVGDQDDAGNIGEWDSTYRHIEHVVRPWCAARGIRFVEISARTGYAIRPATSAKSKARVKDARSLFGWLWDMGQIPVSGPDRICTRIAKVERFEAWLDATYPGREVEVWIGFDAAEPKRVKKDPNAGKPRRVPRKGIGKVPKWWRWTVGLAFALSHARRLNRFPLMERGLCRCRCLELARASGYPVPRKSACVFCCYATKSDFQALDRERPAVFAKVVELETRKPLTIENGLKLTIKAFDSKSQSGVPLGVYVKRPSRPAKPKPCKFCGAAVPATKATGCTYLEDNHAEAA